MASCSQRTPVFPAPSSPLLHREAQRPLEIGDTKSRDAAWQQTAALLQNGHSHRAGTVVPGAAQAGWARCLLCALHSARTTTHPSVRTSPCGHLASGPLSQRTCRAGSISSAPRQGTAASAHPQSEEPAPELRVQRDGHDSQAGSTCRAECWNQQQLPSAVLGNTQKKSEVAHHGIAEVRLHFMSATGTLGTGTSCSHFVQLRFSHPRYKHMEPASSYNTNVDMASYFLQSRHAIQENTPQSRTLASSLNFLREQQHEKKASFGKKNLS